MVSDLPNYEYSFHRANHRFDKPTYSGSCLFNTLSGLSVSDSSSSTKLRIASHPAYHCDCDYGSSRLCSSCTRLRQEGVQSISLCHEFNVCGCYSAARHPSLYPVQQPCKLHCSIYNDMLRWFHSRCIINPHDKRKDHQIEASR